MHDELSRLSAGAKTRQQREDLRRMAFRRAIEDRLEAKRLEVALADFAESLSLGAVLPELWASRRSNALHP